MSYRSAYATQSNLDREDIARADAAWEKRMELERGYLRSVEWHMEIIAELCRSMGPVDAADIRRECLVQCQGDSRDTEAEAVRRLLADGTIEEYPTDPAAVVSYW